MARNIEDHVAIRAALKREGVRLASVVENVDESASGQLIENIMASIAQFYSGNLADEVRKGMRQKILGGGWPHQPPRGYVVVRNGEGRGTHVEVHPKEGPLVRSAFELYATGWYSVKALTQRLAASGLITVSGGPIAHSNMRRILANPFYMGRLRWGELEAHGSHPPLVSPQLFEKVQATLKAKYRNPGTRGGINGFYLRGLAICGTCRGNMTAERHGKWGYYRCGRNAYRKDLCRAKFCNSDKAHRDVERVCRQVRLSLQVADEIRDEARRRIDMRLAASAAERERIESEQSRLLDQEMRLTEAFTGGDISSDVYKPKAADLRKRRAEVLAALGHRAIDRETMVNELDEVLKPATSLSDIYEQLPDAKRVQLLSGVFETLVLGPEGVMGFNMRPPFAQIAKAAAAPDQGASAQPLANSIIESIEQSSVQR